METPMSYFSEQHWIQCTDAELNLQVDVTYGNSVASVHLIPADGYAYPGTPCPITIEQLEQWISLLPDIIKGQSDRDTGPLEVPTI